MSYYNHTAMVARQNGRSNIPSFAVSELLRSDLSRMLASITRKELIILTDRPVGHGEINVHSHPELCFAIEERLLVDTQAGTVTLDPGNVLVVPPSVYHFAHAAGSRCLTLWFAARENHMSIVLSEMNLDGKWGARDAADLMDFSDASHLLREIIVEYESKRSLWFPICRNLLERLLLLAGRAISAGPAGRGATHERGRSMAERARGFIMDNFTKDLSLEDVAHHVGLSPNYLATLYKTHFGTTIIRSIAEARLAEATRLLQKTDRTVSAIADEVGYENASYFSRMFRSHTGISPTEFRRRLPDR